MRHGMHDTPHNVRTMTLPVVPNVTVFISHGDVVSIGNAGGQEGELQREVSALLGKLDAQGQQLAELQHHQTQARQLTATLHSTTDALEKSQAELQQTASALESTQQQLAQARAAMPFPLRLDFTCQVSSCAVAKMTCKYSG